MRNSLSRWRKPERSRQLRNLLRRLLLLPVMVVLLCALVRAGSEVAPALADAGGFPTPTPTVTPLPTITLTPTWTPVPTVFPTSALLAPPSPTALVIEIPPAQAASTRQPVTGLSLSGILCWPFAIGFLVIAVLVATIIFRPLPP